MVKSFVKTSDKRMKLVYKKVIEPQLGNLSNHPKLAY